MIQRGMHRIALALVVVLALTGIWALPVSADLDLIAGDLAEIVLTDGDGVNVRDAAGLSAGILTTLPEGYVVSVESEPISADDGSEWYAITVETTEGTVSGFVLADFLTRAAEGATASMPENSSTGGVLVEVSAGGDNLNIRADASVSAEVLAQAPDGALLDVLGPAVIDADGTAWSPVRYGDVTGFSATAYLAAPGATSPSETSASDSALAGTAVFTIGGTAAVAGTGGDGLHLRAEATTNADSLAILPDGTLLTIVTAGDDAWYQVDVADVSGWVHGDYLTGIPSTISAPLSAGDASLGLTIAAGALSYLGVPYLAGGAAADGVDADGLVWLVIDQDLGIEFPATIAEQSISGAYVARADLAPGDLVFFQNTDQPGLAHVGIALGDGQFISASAEVGSVTIGNLADPYWDAGYLTARRVAEPTGSPTE